MKKQHLARRSFLQQATLGSALCLVGQSARAARPKPNVIVILTDDQGWGDIRSHGNLDIETPEMDRLAAEGARFDRFFVSPVCSPTRAAVLTGRYSNRMGVWGTSAGEEVMALGERTIAEIFKDGGYATGCFGKWHNGEHYPYHPIGRGFDEFFGFCLGHWNNYFNTAVEHNMEPVRTEGYINDVFTSAALDWIGTVREQPFFCYIPYNTPHTPFQVPDKYFDACKARGLDDTLASAYGMCKNLDDNVGRILARLDQHGIAEDTIVVFFGDNGPNGQRYNGEMRGTKGSVHEGGCRNALFLRYPAAVAPDTRVVPIAAHVDLLPTLADLAGIPVGDTKPLDGKSLAPLLRGEVETLPDRMLFTEWRGKGAVRTQRYRWVTEPNNPSQLYDMVEDPGEKNDITTQRPQVAAELKAAYESWVKEWEDFPKSPPPIPVGHVEMPRVIMTCSEGTWSGDLDWGGMYPNNNWATHWTSLDCAVSWEVDVVRAGDFAIELEYICTAADLGAEVEVAGGGSTCTGVIDRAQEPNYVPSPDRVPRKEVYERVWATLHLGTLRLPKGRTTVTVRALSKPGAAVMDLKSVQLVRVA